MKNKRYLCKRCICIHLVLLISAFYIFAQEKNQYRFRTFSPEGGFYYDGISSIQQDKEGFIWILMDNDLFRFDGYEYKRFYPYFKNTSSTGEKQFNTLAADSLGKVYVGTTYGLFEYNKRTDLFTKKLEGQIGFLKIDHFNNLWAMQSGRFGKYNEAADTLEFAKYEGKEIQGINALEGDSLGFFASSAYNRIYRYDLENEVFSIFYLFPESYRIQYIKRYQNKLWVLTSNCGLIKINIPTAEIEATYDFFKEKKGDRIPTRNFHIDKNGLLWIATLSGLYLFNPETERYSHEVHTRNAPYSLPNNSIWYITEDQQKNIWIGTFSGGLCYVNIDEKKRFNTYTSKNSPLNSAPISGFAEDEKYIWVSTEGGGLNRIDKQTKAFTLYTNNPEKSGSISSNNLKSVVPDSKGNLWIATFRGGLDCLNTKTGTFKHFKNDPEEINSLRNNNLRKIVAEADSGLWIAYQLNRLLISYYSFEKKTFTHYAFNQEGNNSFIFDICRGNHRSLWIATHQSLYRMNTQTGVVENMHRADSIYLGAQTLCVDGKQNVWIGTIGRGLIQYNTKTGIYTEIPDILNFDVSSIYSICTDDEDNLWLGTDNGLFRYCTSSGSFHKFGKYDDVQGAVYYPLATFKNKHGDLYIGGTNGFSIVNPKDIVINHFKPHVIISDFYVDNVPTMPRSHKTSSEHEYRFPKEIVLHHSQSNFGFSFSSNNYMVPEKSRFKYRLKNYDERWIEVNASNRRAFFTKVPAGKYTFEVLSANNDGEWSNEVTSVRITRLPAPWLSWYAYVVYFTMAMAMAFLIIRYYHQQRKLKLQLYIEKLDQEKKDEIHQTQLRFFTNISHDFRTPLSLILAALEKLRHEGLKEYYYRILHGNSQRLLNLVNELMDFRTVENEKMPLQVEPVDVNHFVKELAFYFEDYSKQRKITFKVFVDPDLPKPLYIDKNIVEKVVMNLLNNAFKYTRDGGVISIETHYKRGRFVSKFEHSYIIQGENDLSESFMIAVRDTGVGISKNAIASVFERFYKVNTVNFDAHLGTGIGLALVKGLVRLHKGSICVYSKREKGTDMVVTLSSNPETYKEDERKIKEHLEERHLHPEDEHIIDVKKNEQYEQLLNKRDKKRIMLVEDHNDLRALIADFLSADYEIIEASNGLIASDMLEEIDVDLIISDIMMPEKDGITFCSEVKNNVNFSHIPFMLLTAKTSIDSKIEGADSGADIYFEKPIDFNLLRLSIQNIFKHQQQLKDYYAKNYFADSAELAANQQDGKFLKQFISILDKNLGQPDMDVNYIASELSMSRSKLYNKIKSLTDKSIIEFITSYKLRKAANLIVKEDISMREVMDRIGFESQSYFTRAFKKEFGETPTGFAGRHKKQN